MYINCRKRQNTEHVLKLLGMWGEWRYVIVTQEFDIEIPTSLYYFYVHINVSDKISIQMDSQEKIIFTLAAKTIYK